MTIDRVVFRKEYDRPSLSSFRGSYGMFGPILPPDTEINDKLVEKLCEQKTKMNSMMFVSDFVKAKFRDIKTQLDEGNLKLGFVIRSRNMQGDSVEDSVVYDKFSEFVESLDYIRSVEDGAKSWDLLNQLDMKPSIIMYLRSDFFSLMDKYVENRLQLDNMRKNGNGSSNDITGELSMRERTEPYIYSMLESTCSELSAKLGISQKDLPDFYSRIKSVENEYVQNFKKLFVRNIGIIFHVANKYRTSKIPFEDLVQEGSIGLYDAIERVRLEKIKEFKAYMIHWVRRKIRIQVNSQQSTISMPVNVSEVILRLYQFEKEHSNQIEGGYENQVDKIAAWTGFGEGRVRNALRTLHISNALSLDAKLQSNAADDGSKFMDFIENKNSTNPEDDCANNEISSLVVDVIDSLENPNHSFVLMKRFWDGATLQEIGDMKGLSRERIRQIEQRALFFFKRELKRRILKLRNPIYYQGADLEENFLSYLER